MPKYLIAIIAILFFVACKSNDSSEASDYEDVEEEADFKPEGGSPLSLYVGMPGVTWSFDTIYGVCSPDTLVLWMTYNGKDYLTNVRGLEDGNFPLLTVKGRKRLEKNMDNPSFIKSDFTEMAILTNYQNISRQDFIALRDTSYVQSLENLKAVVTDFVYSLGNSKHMSANLAASWGVVLAQSEAEGAAAPNPFNCAPAIEFDEGSVMVQVPRPKEGIVEVSAYCLDPFTLGGPGWAYWTIVMCRENGRFKVKEMPARHRKFTIG